MKTWRATVIRLREQGHDVLYASEDEPGAPDNTWRERAESERRVIPTADKDFGELIFRDRLTSHAVVLLRLVEMSLVDRLSRLGRAWPIVEKHSSGKFVVITPSKVRIRDLVAE